MDRRIFIKTSTLAGVSLNAMPILASINGEGRTTPGVSSPGSQRQPDSGSQNSNSSSLETSRVVTYSYPRITPVSPTFTVTAGGRDVNVIRTSVGAFAAFTCDGPVDISIEAPIPIKSIRIAPARHGIKPAIDQGRISFELPKPLNLLIEIEGLEQLYLYANAVDRAAPSPTDSGVYYFKGGQVYEVGMLRLQENETLYIEGGAVVRGCIRATSAKHVRIAGQGVLDGSYYQRSAERRRSIVLEDCRDSRIEGIIMIEPSSWMIVLGACQNVTVSNVKELGNEEGCDGVDIVGSRHICVEDCFFRNGDDCIAVKSLDLRGHRQDATLDYTRDVEDVEVTGCSFLVYSGGQALEIGHELRTASVSRIRFRDCDILGVHGYGAAFGIHNADRATISDVLYEDIRVEHHYNKLLEFRTLESRWSKDNERGHIRNVTLRNIDVAISIYNPGYTVSVIGGCDKDHTVEQVRFESFRLNGKPARSADDLDLFTRNARDISFS